MKASDFSILATSEAYRDTVAFWRAQLAAPSDLAGLPAAPGGDARARQALNVPVPPATQDVIGRLAQDELGRFAVVTAVVALALTRYLNRTRVLIRTAVIADGTTTPLNTAGEVPIVLSAGPEATLRQFLTDAATIIGESYSQQDFPILTLAEHEHGVDWRSLAVVSLSSTGIHGEGLREWSAVHINLDDLDSGLTIHFDPAAVDSALVDGLGEVLTQTMGRLSDLATAVRDISRIPQSQRRRLVSELSRGDDTPGAFRPVTQAFEARVTASPDAVAIQHDRGTWSYAELNAQANRLANQLRTQPGGDAPVGIWMDRSPWMVVAVLGVLKAGLAYVPIDADCPPDRLAFFVRDSGLARLLTDTSKTAAAASLPCDVVAADRELPASADAPDIQIRPDDVAYILYTSGSTGTPKGCVIEHHSLSNYLEWACRYYWVEAHTGTMALFTPLSFDLTVPSLFCPLLRGRPLVVYPQHLAVDDVLKRQFAPDSGIDSVKLTPSHIAVVGAASLAQTGVQLAIVGGEALTHGHVAILRRLNPGMRIVNEYGPTEATVGCVVRDIVGDGSILIGRPIANTQAYVLDDEQQLLAVGIRGELCVGGAGVARGYLGRPDLEAERFVANPFVQGGRLYRTGDIARWLPQGELECFGRLDHQLKIRGYRIEPAEVEAAVRQLDGVRDVVVTSADAGHGPDLVAYFVADGNPTVARLRRDLAALLPSYMVPAMWVPLTALPLTANGKVDRTKLPSPMAPTRRRDVFVEPQTEHERVICGIWADLFKAEPISTDDNFFELGGHSLMAMAMMPRVHEALGVEMSVSEVLTHPTPASLGRLLASRRPSTTAAIDAIPDADHYVVSHGQRRLWVIDRIEEESPAYNVSAVFDVRGSLDDQALRAAIDAVIARHESLRTVLIEVGDEPRQRVLPPFSLPVEIVDLRDHPDSEARLHSLVESVSAGPFDLGRGPLLRVHIFRRDDEHAVLALVMHHVVSDAWSMRVLMAELLQHYHAHHTGLAPQVPALPMQYRDYAAWAERRLRSGGMDDARRYWLDTLSGSITPLQLPADAARPPVPNYRGRHAHATIDASTGAALRALGAQHDASPFMTLTAVVTALLHRYSGQTDIWVGTPIAGREHPDLANQIGFYVNTLVLRTQVDAAQSFATLLTQVVRAADGALTHQAFPFDRLVDELAPPRDLSRAPLFDVMVVYDHETDLSAPDCGLSVEELRLETGVSKFDLTFAFAESPRGIHVEIEYSTALFSEARITRLMDHLQALAACVVRDPSTPVAALALGSAIPEGVVPAATSPAAPPTQLPGLAIAPRDERELVLVGQLEATLGRSGISISDNYFHLGGDSITAIQVVNRLSRHGWALRVRDIFESPRIDALAARLTRAGARAPRRATADDVPLSPIQHWFFLTQPDDRDHYNQSVMLRFGTPLEDDVVRAVGRALVDHHEALRLRFRKDGDQIAQFYGEGYDPLTVHDLRQAEAPSRSLETLAAEAQASLDLEHGPLARLLLCHLPDEDRLLAVIHHLAVDGVSWRILLEDLRSGLAQGARGESIALGLPTDAYQAWTSALSTLASAADAERLWWERVESTDAVRLPADDAAGVVLEAEAVEQRLTLSPATTAALLTEVHHAYDTHVQDVLLTALATAMQEWAGPGPVVVDVEAHGREGVDGVDVSRTVGWFTALYPLVLDIDAGMDTGARLTRIKEQLRQTPGHGLGYGLLRGGRPSGARILFNFLGQFDTSLGGLDIAVEDRGPEHGPRARLTHDLVIGGFIAHEQLELTVRYGRARFRDEVIARLAGSLEAALLRIVAHCRAHATRGAATRVRYADATTPALIERLGPDRVEDVYPLSPMQLGMLYHSALGDQPSIYVEQFVCDLSGDVNVQAFRDAWTRVIARHPALRTAVFWERVEQPVQVVFSRADAPWTQPDWRHLPADEQHERLAALARDDRRKGVALDAAPLLRFTLVRLADVRYRFIWTSHHVVLDGWSTANVLQEVFAIYQAATSGADVVTEPVRPFGDYIDWLRAQDPTQSRAYWRAQLHDVVAPTPLPRAGAPRSDAGSFLTLERTLSREATSRLTTAAREQALTLNTVARGVWATLLASDAHTRDVVFGATVAGRPADLAGVSAMVGLFINTVPVRMRLEPTMAFAEWLRGAQREHAQMDQHSFSPLADIQLCSGVPPRTPLFDSLLVFENYPVDQSLDPERAGLRIDGIHVIEHTNYPLTLMVIPGEPLLLRLTADASRYDRSSAGHLLDGVLTRFEAFAAAPGQTVGHVIGDAAMPAASHRFELDMDAAPARALVAMLCHRYSANEDLLCVCNHRPLVRDHLQPTDTFDNVVRALETTAAVAAPPSTTRSDLAFEVSPRGGRLHVAVTSESGRFDATFLRRTEDHLRVMSAAISAHPGTALAEVPIMPDHERTRVLRDFNRTDKDWGTHDTIVQMFEAQAAAQPDQLAVWLPSIGRDDMATDLAWSYGELNSRANQLARVLVRDHAVGPDVRVGVLMERCLEMVLALVAVEKAGGAYVPLDPDYPPDLLRFMQEDSGATVVLTQDRFRSLAAAAGAAVLCLDTDWPIVAVEREDNLESRVCGDHLAYVIYTSGSTGRPKGAMNTHRGIANRLRWMQDAYHLTPHDRVLQKTPYSFDVSVWEFFWPLMTGAPLVVAKPGGHRDAAYLMALIAHTNVSTVHFVPSMLQAFIEEPGIERCTGLARVICSGEAITPELLRRYTARIPVPLHNLYGPTEAAVDVTAWACDPAEARTLVPIGTPIANIRLYILDERMAPVPEGITGELYLGGVGVGRGYLNRPDLTAAKFVPDPFAPVAGARLYRTGDLARYRASGIVDFLGRIDHQVKLRGFRIELGEIESALLTHHAVRECVVIVREDQPGLKRLVAYVVYAHDQSDVSSDLTQHLQRTLPPHMVPGVVVPLPALPRLTNGKLDRKALPIPDAASASANRQVAPRDPIEQRLAQVWSDVLGHRHIGVTDDFFTLGGQSILALKLVSAIQVEFGRGIPLAQLLAHSTIERLAVALRAGHDPHDWRPLVTVRRGSSAPPLFLLPGAGGNVLYFQALAHALTTSRPIYGLQAVGLDGRTPPLTTVDAIAAANIDEIRRVCPSGPYLLAGHSFGGRVALEMARQLTEAGAQVALLAILDTAAPTFEPAVVGAAWEDVDWLLKIVHEIEVFFGIDLALNRADLAPLTLEAQLTHVVDAMQAAGVWAPGANPEHLRGFLNVYRAHTQAPHLPYDRLELRVPITLFKAHDRDADIDAPPEGLTALTKHADWGWSRFARGTVRVIDVPGAHLSMLAAPHVVELACGLDVVLADTGGGQ